MNSESNICVVGNDMKNGTDFSELFGQTENAVIKKYHHVSMWYQLKKLFVAYIAGYTSKNWNYKLKYSR